MASDSPVSWVSAIVRAIEWPGVVIGAFAAGRYIEGLEHRVDKAETRLQALVERHMPAIHRSLAEIRGLLLSRR